MKYQVVVGIDPGLTGAVAILRGQRAAVYDAPVVAKKRGKGKFEFDIEAMVRLLEQVDAAHNEALAAIEYVSAMPKQGTVSVFRFGYGAGIWRGITTALHIPVVMVTPPVWKKAMLGEHSGDDKHKSLKQARKLFPQLKGELARVRDNGRADALLIAEWSRRTHE